MHHALHIEELLLHIFSYCFTPSFPWSPRSRDRRCYANADLAAVARTCRTFKEPAMDLIWDRLDDLTPLVRCLSQSAVNEKGEYLLVDHLTQTEWDVILCNARRVQALPYLRDSLGLTEDCIKVLSDPPAPASFIFPNLCVVGMCQLSTSITPILPHLANPKLMYLSIERPKDLGPCIKLFAERYPNILDFYVSPQTRDSDDVDFPYLLCQWEKLRSLSCSNVGLNADTLIRLSRLHDLHSMRFKVHNVAVDHIHLTPISRLFRHLHFPIIHRLILFLDTPPTSPELTLFFLVVREACTQNRDTPISIRLQVIDDDLIENSPPVCYITFECLGPLTPLTNIRSITILISVDADLSEAEWLSLASHWPHLEVFMVGRDWTPSSGITPGGFLKLLERCRSLHAMNIMLDTRGYTEIPRGHPWLGLPSPRRRWPYIHLLHSPIEEESIHALGVFFHVMAYPDFKLLTHWDLEDEEESVWPRELCNLYHGRWEKVSSLARDLWEQMRDLKQSLESRTFSATHDDK